MYGPQSLLMHLKQKKAIKEMTNRGEADFWGFSYKAHFQLRG
jgi:hypothetical protein